MHGARVWQLLTTVLLMVIIMSLRYPSVRKNETVKRSDRELNGLLKEKENCSQPVIVNIISKVDVAPVNASFAHQKWVSLKNDQVKMLGFQRPTKGFITIGIPSVKRINNKSYLVETVSSIIDKTSTEEKIQVVVVVFLADFDTTYNAGVVKVLTEKFMDYINMGFIQIIQAVPHFYPSLTNLKRNFNDKEERVKWRSKQVVDFAFMFLYAQNLSNYYLQIEDDVICANNFLTGIREYIKSMEHTQWAMLEFSELGFIGKLFKSEDLLKLGRYMLMFYEEQPVDFLMSYFRLSMAQRKAYLRKPTLFQHIGLKSSLKLKADNKLKDKYFDSGDKPWKSDDPPGVVITNMKSYQQWHESLAYGSGSGFFWASNVKEGDWFVVAFNEPVKLKRVIVETGHPKTGKDRLISGIMEWSPKVIKLDEAKQQVTCASLQKLGTFVKGRLDVGNLNEPSSPTRGIPVNCLKITIGPDQKDWVVFNQVAVFVDKS